eukprot:snap_masked-scaffold_89-processed-gene-0.37-mRNA-1 protein AED:0.46 eAED:0.46 QI:0/0/0/0.5/1/1/2/0/870
MENEKILDDETEEFTTVDGKKMVGEITVQGKEHTEAVSGAHSFMPEHIYILLTRDVTETFLRCKLLVVGKARAGKTSLIKQLLGQEFDSREQSTRGCKLLVSKVSKNRDALPWSEEDDEGDHFVSFLGKILENSLVQINYRNVQESSIYPKGKLKVDTKFIPSLLKRVKEDQTQELLLQTGPTLGFSIWDFGGQSVFYSLHHLFLTDYGCYLVVFDAKKMLDEDQGERKLEIDFLKFWLNSKKLHAPKAPLFIVGTHCENFSTSNYNTVDNLFLDQVFEESYFEEQELDDLGGLFGQEASGCFHPVDSKTSFGIEILRNSIELTVQKQEFLTNEIKLSYLRVYDILRKQKKDYISIVEIEKLLEANTLKVKRLDKVLMFLTNRGLLTYFPSIEKMQNKVILNPQWLIDCFSLVIFERDTHKAPAYDSKYSREYRIYLRTGIITEDLLHNIWGKAKLSSAVRKYLKSVMKLTLLLCDYPFLPRKKQYLIPTFPAIGSNPTNNLESASYTGLYDDDEDSVRYLPFGLFERLLCLVIEQSASYGLDNNKTQQISGQQAQLSFGLEVSFEMKVTENPKGDRVWIKVQTHREANFDKAKLLIETIYSMTDGLRQQLFGSKEKGGPALSIKLLLPSSEDTENVLVSYEKLLQIKEKGPDQAFYPLGTDGTLRKVSDYVHWFEENGNEEVGSISKNLMKPENPRRPLDQLGIPPGTEEKKLPSGTEFHCFFSYKQNDSIDVVGKLHQKMTTLGYKCWFDQVYSGADGLTRPAMKKGVETCMIYILFLSRDIFASNYVCMELQAAVDLGKKIMFLSHPDTNHYNYVPFSHYINTAPDALKNLFDTVEALHIRRKYYEEAAFLRVFTERVEKYRSSLMS